MVMAKKQLNPRAAPYVCKYDVDNNTSWVYRHKQQRLPAQPFMIVYMPTTASCFFYKPPANFYYDYSFVRTTATTTNTTSIHDEHEHELLPQPQLEERKNNKISPRKRTQQRLRRRGCCSWVPKSSSSGATATTAHIFNSKFAGNNYTTVMIKNVPNQLTRNSFMATLDDACLQQNRNLMSNDKARARLSCAYDFLYLPIDFRTGCNREYAFVNFTSPEAAVKVCASLHGRTWRSKPHSMKICEISPARIQCKTELIKHFKNVCYQCTNPDYLPVVLHPPRDGSGNTSSIISTIGILVGYGSMH